MGCQREFRRWVKVIDAGPSVASGLALAFDQVPTSFDLTKMNTLLPVSEMRGVRQILSDAIADLKAKGVVQ